MGYEMFKEITDRETILELGAAGVLWDSWFIRDSDASHPTYGSYIWDSPQPVGADDWNASSYYLDVEGVDEEDLQHTKYRFYIQTEA